MNSWATGHGGTESSDSIAQLALQNPWESGWDRIPTRNEFPNFRSAVLGYATTARLVLAQTCVPEKTNEITAIPDLLDELAETDQLEGALVTIDAMGCQVEIADKIVAHKADYLLALKGNQPTLETDVEDYFRTAPATKLASKTTLEKGHGRIETRVYTASAEVDWMTSERSYPGAPRFFEAFGHFLARVIGTVPIFDQTHQNSHD